METKTCIKCNVNKPISEFHKNNRNKTGIKNTCRSCCSQYCKDHREEANAYKKKNAYKYKEKRSVYLKQYRKTEKYKQYHKTEKIKEYHRKYNTTQEYRDYKNQYRIDNYDLVRGKEREREREYNKRPEVRIKRALRARLLGILKRGEGSKSGKMIELIGCTMPFLRQYLESLWQKGMSWNNYGFGRGRWVMDHIVACEKFDLTDKEQQIICFNYKNIQPLWWEENAAKSNK